jgi:molecular chaperone DnaK
MILRLGIDLGTTFSCLAWVGDDGHPRMIPDADGEPTTPSVIWFDGRQAWVGKKANARKETDPFHIREFVKRDMGKPAAARPGQPEADAAAYEVNGFRYGAAGMSALILRKLKRDAVRFFKKLGHLEQDADEPSTSFEAVITVPAYFGENERAATKLAGYAAGLNVIGIINEPTAAALSYGLLREKDARILVFDLGGGTFDVTILQMRYPEAIVLTTMGDNSLGGKDWDALIEAHVYESFERVNRRSIADDLGFEVQRVALKAKFDLSAHPEARLTLATDRGDLDLTLHERAPGAVDEFTMTDGPIPFYFEHRAAELLSRCEVLCEAALARVKLPTPSGSERPMNWADVDQIILSGGACRMPMIPRMLERISRHRIRRQIAGFDFDTAIAAGAALYSHNRGRVFDVMSHTIGVVVSEKGNEYIEPILRKDEPLPAEATRAFPAPAMAYVEVYEVTGEGKARKDENRARGRLDLENPGAVAEVVLRFEVDENGLLRIVASYPPNEQRELQLKAIGRWTSKEAEVLREKIMSVRLQG